MLSYTQVSSYSFEDAGGWVKVYILMKGVGELGDGAISADFGDRNMSVKICGWDNKNWRLQVLPALLFIRFCFGGGVGVSEDRNSTV